MARGPESESPGRKLAEVRAAGGADRRTDARVVTNAGVFVIADDTTARDEEQ
jgi:hypothetical protein